MNVAFSSASPAAVAADVLVLGVPAGKLADVLAAVPALSAGLGAVAAEEDFTGKPGSVLSAPSYGALAASREIGRAHV